MTHEFDLFDNFWIDSAGNQYNVRYSDDYIDVYKKEGDEFVFIFRYPKEVIEGYDNNRERGKDGQFK